MIAESPTQIATSPNGQQKWTYDEIAALPDDKLRELHDGHLLIMPSPTARHQKIYRRLLKFIEAWLDGGGRGLIYLQLMDLKIDDYNVVVPDLTYYATDDESAVESENGKYLRAVPDLVVEIVSPSSQRTDRYQKLDIYAAMGVKYYWTIDPAFWIFQAFRLVDGEYRFEASLSDEGEFAPAVFPGLKLPMPELFGPRHPSQPGDIEQISREGEA